MTIKHYMHVESDRFGLAAWVTMAAVVLAVGLYYRWEVRSAGYGFDWVQGNGGYYQYLGRAFAEGRLSLPIEPRPELLALSNPWDPSVGESFKMHDMAFYQGRYYLYHGPAPAAFLFAPWRRLTGRDLPENFALWLLCCAGYVFACAALLEWLAMAGVRPSPALLAAMLLALGLTTAVPFLLSRVWVYEVAIGGGYCAIAAALFFLAKGIRQPRSGFWLAGSGVLFGIAIACRPHLGLFGLAALGSLMVSSRRVGLTGRAVLTFAAGFAAVGAAIAVYNYQRFGDPFEFGIRYLLAGANQNRIRLSGANVLPGLYYWIACAPGISGVFPWVRAELRHPFGSADHPFPAGYFIEPTTGALYLAPVLVLGLLAFLRGSGRERILFWTAWLASAAVLLFLAATGFTTERYAVDFLPAAVLAAVAGIGIRISRMQGVARAVASVVLAGAVAAGAIVNLALAITGPYDEMLKNRPRNYVRLAGWFSPAAEYKPMLNPNVEIAFTAEPAGRQPLVTMGRQVHRYGLHAENAGGRLRLISSSDRSEVVREIEAPGRPAAFELVYSPGSGAVAVSIDGREVLVHAIGTLVTAPADVRIGDAVRFAGRVREARRLVVGDRR